MVKKKLFSNIFLIIFTLWLSKLFFYALELKNLSIYLSLILAAIIISLIIFSIIYIFKTFNKKKLIITLNFFVSFCLLIVTSLIYDFYKDHLNNKSKTEQFKKRVNKAKEIGVNFDKRTNLELFNELKTNNQKVGFSYNPSIVLKQISEIKENNFLPLSGLSKTLIIDCNESGKYSTFISDRYGFNNNDKLFEKNEKRIILIGDSFVQGQCVDQKDTISSKLNNLGHNVISLGLAGNGPLLELAILKEYGLNLEPGKVIWFFSENDIRDLEKNSKYKILKNYYNKDYSQKIIDKQMQTDKFWKTYEKEQLEKKNRNIIDFFSKKIERALFLKSFKNFALDILKNDYIEYESIDDEFVKKFIEIIELSKALTEEIGGEFYFVYIPFYNSVFNEEPKSKEMILNEIKNLNIRYLDFHKVLNKHNDPFIFFPLKIEGHYSVSGYELLAKEIANKFLK